MAEPMSWYAFKHYTVIDPQQYDISEDILTVEKGFLLKKRKSIPLYNLKEAKLSRTVFQRIFGLCTIVLVARENSENEIILENIWYNDGEIYYTIVHEIDRLYRELMMYRYHRSTSFFDCDYIN